jgi:hypothetical protein
VARWLELLLLLIASLGLSGCAAPLPSQQPLPRLTTGFWFWQGSSAEAAWSGEMLDVLFVHVGTIRKDSIPPYIRKTGDATERWFVYGDLTSQLPAAKEYWLVFRYEQPGVPDLQVAPIVAGEVSRVWADARKRDLKAVGVQFDIDSPTGSLADYARFLREVRKGLPQGFEISITALLDWFRSGTAIGDVIKETDEFVPQFYDLADPSSYGGGPAIAAKIDAARWGPVFNRFRKRFRLGISTFGRAQLVPKEAAAKARFFGISSFGDVAPIDIATNPAFQLQSERNQANELVLSYRAARKTRVGYTDFDPGDAFQFILATPEAIRAAMASARQIGGYLAGAVFFRWPSSYEALVMQPDEVLIAAGVTAPGSQRHSRVQVVDGRCAAVECVDVYLESADPFSPKPLRYRIRTSTELEYFLPEKNLPVRMTGPSQLELSLPPYCGRGHLYIGRAVTALHADFTIEEEQ